MSLNQLAYKGGRGAGDHFHIDIVSGLVAPAGEHAHLVASGASAEFLGILLGRPLHKNSEHLSDVVAVALEAQLVLQGDDLVQPSGLHVGRNIVRIVSRGECPWSLGVVEHVGIVETDLAEKFEGLPVVLLGLRAEP